MTEPFATPADLARMLNTTEENVLRWRREQAWPSLKVGKQIRFTPDHVRQILERLEAKPEKPAPTEIVVAGQTARSARARRSA